MGGRGAPWLERARRDGQLGAARQGQLVAPLDDDGTRASARTYRGADSGALATTR
jgi:hypothetical protein